MAPVLEWVALHRQEFRADWDCARDGTPLESIAPLDLGMSHSADLPPFSLPSAIGDFRMYFESSPSEMFPTPDYGSAPNRPGGFILVALE